MALSGAIVTDASGTGVFFGTPSQSGGSSSGTSFVVDVINSAYGAVGDGVTDDTTAFQLAVAAAVTLAGVNGSAHIFVPKGTYVIQDPDTDPRIGLTDGPIRIPIGVSITLRGEPGARLLLGANGCGKGMIRVFGRRCVVEGLEIDLNGTIPLQTKNNVGIEINGSGNGTDDVDGCDNVVRDCYVHGSRYLLEYSTGTISYDHTGNGSGERVVILDGGTWPALSATNGVIKIPYDANDPTVGTWYDITTRVSNSVIQLSSSDNPGADVAASTAYMLNAEPYSNGGHDGIQILGGNRNQVYRNIVVDAGWNALRANGEGNILSRNILKDFRGNGIRIADGGYGLVEGNWISSVHCSGRSNLLADAGSGADNSPDDSAALTNADVRTTDLVIRDNYSYCNSNGNFEGAGSALKLAATRHCIVDGGVYKAGTDTNNTAIRIEDCIRKITFQNLRCVGPFQQTNNAMTAAVTATVSRASGTYAGKLQLTIASHGQVLGKSVWLVNCPVANWDDEEFIVLEVVDSNNIVVGRVTDDEGTVTPEPYAAGSITGTVAHACVHELVMKNLLVERGTHDENNFVRFITSPWVTIEDCIFEQVSVRTTGTVKESGLLFDYPSDSYIKRLRVVNNEFRFYTSALCKAIRSSDDEGTTEVQRVTLINNGGSPAGSFTLTCGSLGPTGAITWSSNTTTMASNIQTALRLLTGFGAVTVAFVSGDYTAGAIFSVTFKGVPGNVTQLTNADSMTGSVHSIAHSTTTAGAFPSAFTTSGKFVCYGNRLENKSTGTVELINRYESDDVNLTYADRLIMFSSDGDSPSRFTGTAAPTSTAFAWNQGDAVRNLATTAGSRPGWRCVTTTAAGTSPSFQQEAALS